MVEKQDNTLQPALSVMTPEQLSSTFPQKPHPAPHKKDGDTSPAVTTHTSTGTKTTGRTKQNTVGKKMVQGSTVKPWDISLNRNNSSSKSHLDLLEQKKPTWSRERTTSRTHSVNTLYPEQTHMLDSATKRYFIKKDKTSLENTETVISSPNTQPEDHTAQRVTSEESGLFISSEKPQDSEFSSSSISTAKVGFVASSRSRTSEQEEEQAAKQLMVTPAGSAAPLAPVQVFNKASGEREPLKVATPETSPTPNPAVVITTPQNGGALDNRASAGGTREKEEIEAVSPNTDRTPLKKESNREADGHEIKPGVERGSDDEAQASQPPAYTHPRPHIRPGRRGQRVRHRLIVFGQYLAISAIIHQ